MEIYCCPFFVLSHSPNMKFLDKGNKLSCFGCHHLNLRIRIGSLYFLLYPFKSSIKALRTLAVPEPGIGAGSTQIVLFMISAIMAFLVLSNIIYLSCKVSCFGGFWYPIDLEFLLLFSIYVSLTYRIMPQKYKIYLKNMQSAQNFNYFSIFLHPLIGR